MKKTILSFAITIVILVVIFFSIDKEKWLVFLNVSVVDILIAIFIANLINNTSGFQFYLIRKQFGVSLKLKDIFLLPAVMGLWSFILPFQGSLIFSTLFFKQKYDMKISESFSINIYLYLVTLSFTGLFGLIFSIVNDMLISWLSLISFLFLINPLLILFANNVLKNIGRINIKFIDKLYQFTSSVVENTNQLWQNAGFTLWILIVNFFRLFLSVVWLYYISYALGFNFSFFEVAMLSLIMSVSLIIKLTPGNLGTVQLIAGGFMGLIGHTPEQAILITLFASATVLILNFTVGIIGNLYYFKTINFFALKNKESKN